MSSSKRPKRSPPRAIQPPAVAQQPPAADSAFGQRAAPPGSSPPAVRTVRPPQRRKKKKRRPMPSGQQLSRSERQRRKVRKSRQRQLTRRLAFLVMTFGAAFLAMTVFFRVDKLNVNGTEHYTADEITATLGVEKGDNLFSFRLSALENKIMKEYPYLSRVEIVRDLPDALTVNAVDAVPVAAVDAAGGGCFLIDANGKLLEQVSASPPGIASVTGVQIPASEPGQSLAKSTDKHVKMLLAVTKAIDKVGMAKGVDFINVSATYDVRFSYEKRLDVRLGEATKLDDKLRMFQRIVEDELSPTDTQIIYLSDPTTAYCPPTTPDQIEQSALPLDDIIPIGEDSLPTQDSH